MLLLLDHFLFFFALPLCTMYVSIVIMTVELFVNNWQRKSDEEDLVVREFVFNSASYAAKYNETQTTIHELSGTDELLAGRSYSYT